MSKELNEWIGTVEELSGIRRDEMDVIEALNEILLNVFRDSIISKEQYNSLKSEIEQY